MLILRQRKSQYRRCGSMQCLLARAGAEGLPWLYTIAILFTADFSGTCSDCLETGSNEDAFAPCKRYRRQLGLTACAGYVVGIDRERLWC
jgi:hypothetical protein